MTDITPNQWQAVYQLSAFFVVVVGVATWEIRRTILSTRRRETNQRRQRASSPGYLQYCLQRALNPLLHRQHEATQGKWKRHTMQNPNRPIQPVTTTELATREDDVIDVEWSRVPQTTEIATVSRSLVR